MLPSKIHLSHSFLLRCPNSPAVFPDLLRLSRAICWVRRWLSLDFFSGLCQIFPLVLFLSSAPTMEKEDILVQRPSCAVMGVGALKQSKPSCCCRLSDAEHSEGFYSHGGMLEAGWRLRPAPEQERVTGWWKLPLLSIWVLLGACLGREEFSMARPCREALVTLWTSPIVCSKQETSTQHLKVIWEEGNDERRTQ